MNLSFPGGPLRDRLLEFGRWSVLLCLFSVPINKPATSIFLFLALICSVFGSNVRARFTAATRHPVAGGALIWFVYLLINVLLGPPGREGWDTLGVYKAVLYPLIVMTLIDTERWRNRAFMAFGVPAALILLATLIEFAVIFGSGMGVSGYTGSFTIFKNYTQQGIEFLVLASLAAAFARQEQIAWRRNALWTIAGAALAGVIFVLQSRTAYLIVVPLLLYWLWQLTANKAGGWRRAVLGIAVFAAIGVAALSTPRVQQRLTQAADDLERYSSQKEATSIGIRFELWQKTIPIIQAAPWFGHGLGQWQIQYREQVKGLSDYKYFIMGHPHQEVLLILAEQGVAGLLITVLLMALLIAYIRRLDQPYRDFYMCLVLIYLAAGLTNCVLLDFSHRHVLLMLLALIPLAPARATIKTGSA